VNRVVVKKEAVIPARADTIFALLSDYKVQRPKILTPNFRNYHIEKGGKGNGTVVSYRLHAASRERPYHMQVEETIKDQILTERDTNSSLVTTWSLFPERRGAATRVRITTEWEGSKGIGGFFERTFAPLGLKNIYGKMLQALLFLSPGASDEEVTAIQGEEYSPLTNIGIFTLLFGLVMAIAFGLRYLSRRRLME
jgi:hypothetical protein